MAHESEHEPIVRACKRATTAKESPMTQKRLLEMIEEEKERFRARAQVGGKPQGKAASSKVPQ